MQAASSGSEPSAVGVHSIDAGAGIDVTMSSSATATTNDDVRMAELDAFYKALGQTLQRDPHPLDEFPTDLR